MFQTRVFTFSVFTNDSNINIVQTRFNTRHILTERKRGIHIKILTHADVEGLVAQTRGGGEEGTLETDLVTTERGKGFLEERIIFGCQTGHIVLFEFDRHIGSLEDILDRRSEFLTDTITRNESDSVLSSILLGEDLV